jgi:hypothetical protein
MHGAEARCDFERITRPGKGRSSTVNTRLWRALFEDERSARAKSRIF